MLSEKDWLDEGSEGLQTPQKILCLLMLIFIQQEGHEKLYY